MSDQLDLQPDPIFSVSEFIEATNHLLDRMGSVSIQGEISGLAIKYNKYAFFSLKDTEATLECFAMLYQIPNINSFQDGMQVKVEGSSNLHKKSGRFRLIAYSIVPVGAGSIKKAYEKLRRDLQEEGLFDHERKRPLPKFPTKLGLITGEGSQAYNDFVKVADERTSGVNIDFLPTKVQGSEAVKSLLQAIKHFNQDQSYQILVVTRGGGSLEDLQAFNDERVVRAVFASKIPVVCAIGHEGDVSLAELAADLRASTPSNAAGLIFTNKKEILSNIKGYQGRLTTNMDYLLRKQQLSIVAAIGQIRTSLLEHTQAFYKTINQLGIHMEEGRNRVISQYKQLQSLELRLLMSSSNYTAEHTRNIDYLTRLLKSTDHKSILKRGFSITTHQNQVIKNASQLKPGDIINTKFSKGNINSKIQK